MSFPVQNNDFIKFSVFIICSALTEEFVIPANDYISPCVVELKRIPNCASLIVGHNGFGEFAVWYAAYRMSSFIN